MEKNFNARFNAMEKKYDAKFDALEKKFDTKFDAMEKKYDAKFDVLEKKVDNNSAHILRLINTTSKMQKDIADLRDDFYTVYDLEIDTRKQLKLN